MSSTYQSIFYHIVFGVKNRLPLISADFRQDLWRMIGATCDKHDMRALAVGGTADHVHVLLTTRASTTVSSAVKIIKGSSSKWINDLHVPDRIFAWQSGYGVFTVSLSRTQAVARYIQNQEKHHEAMSIDRELEILMGKKMKKSPDIEISG